MLVVRLQRTGRRNVPTYRLVVAEKRSAAKGKAMEFVGHYLPAQNPPVFQFDKERIAHWLKMGAMPSDTLARLLKKEGAQGMERYMKRYSKQKSKSAPKEGEAPKVSAPVPAEAPQESAEEKPKEQGDSGKKKE